MNLVGVWVLAIPYGQEVGVVISPRVGRIVFELVTKNSFPNVGFRRVSILIGLPAAPFMRQGDSSRQTRR